MKIQNVLRECSSSYILPGWCLRLFFSLPRLLLYPSWQSRFHAVDSDGIPQHPQEATSTNRRTIPPGASGSLQLSLFDTNWSVVVEELMPPLPAPVPPPDTPFLTRQFRWRRFKRTFLRDFSVTAAIPLSAALNKLCVSTLRANRSSLT